MTNFTIKDLQKDVEMVLGQTLDKNNGLRLFENPNEVMENILAEMSGQGHYGWNNKYTSIEEYLLDSPKGELAVKDKGTEGKGLKEEYEARKGSYYNSYAMVVLEHCYDLAQEAQDKKEAGWEKECRKYWNILEKIRNYNNHGSAVAVYGTKGNLDGSEDTNLRSWADAEDEMAYDYEISCNGAINQLKEWGEVKKPTFDLATAKDLLRNNWDQAIKDEFKASKITNFKNALRRWGANNHKWNDEASFIDKAIDNCGSEENIESLTNSIKDGISQTFIEHYLDKASKTTEIDKKKKHLEKIEDFKHKYQHYAYQWAFTETKNKNRIDTLKKEVGKTPKTGTSGGDWKNVGLCQRYYGTDPDELKKIGLCWRYYG